METYWLEGYKIAARSKSQALIALRVLKLAGAKPDYKERSERWALCMPNPPSAA